MYVDMMQSDIVRGHAEAIATGFVQSGSHINHHYGHVQGFITLVATTEMKMYAKVWVQTRSTTNSAGFNVFRPSQFIGFLLI